MIHRIAIKTNNRCEIVDLTGQLRALVQRERVQDGVLFIHCPHTTAAVTVNEDYDPSVKGDLLTHLGQLIPHRHPDYTHGEGNSDAHIKAMLIGPTQQLLIDRGQVVLGQWQGVYFCEFDGPRNREVLVKIRG